MATLTFKTLIGLNLMYRQCYYRIHDTSMGKNKNRKKCGLGAKKTLMKAEKKEKKRLKNMKEKVSDQCMLLLSTHTSMLVWRCPSIL